MRTLFGAPRGGSFSAPGTMQSGNQSAVGTAPSFDIMQFLAMLRGGFGGGINPGNAPENMPWIGGHSPFKPMQPSGGNMPIRKPTPHGPMPEVNGPGPGFMPPVGIRDPGIKPNRPGGKYEPPDNAGLGNGMIDFSKMRF